MPLQEVESASLDVGGVRYILFFASGTPSWCPDCREALPAIEKVFGGQDAPLLSVIKVGMRDEWKSPKNKWRGEPFHISETPCIIKFIDVSVCSLLSSLRSELLNSLYLISSSRRSRDSEIRRASLLQSFNSSSLPILELEAKDSVIFIEYNYNDNLV